VMSKRVASADGGMVVASFVIARVDTFMLDMKLIQI
jgi:hypothetical protein